TLTNTAGAPARLAAVGGVQRSSGPTGNVGSPLVVAIFDADGNPIADQAVTFTVVADAGSGAAASFNGAASVTGTGSERGRATAPVLRANGKRGTYAVIATIAGLSTEVVFQVKIV